jgi:hypothetical protein
MHTRHLLRTLVASGVVAALAVPCSAVAQTVTHQDATHDVQRFNVSTDAVTKARHNRAVDIVRTRLTYTNQNLTTTLWLRRGRVGHDWLMVGEVHTGSTHFEWDASQDGTGKSLILYGGKGSQVACDGLALAVKHRKGRLTMTVPSSCLGRPDALREGALFSIQTTDTVSYWDDALQRRGFHADGDVALSRKLHRNR